MNRKYFALFAAASLAAGAMTAQAQNQVGDTANQTQPQTTAQERNAAAGAQAAGQQQSPYADDIRRVLARVTEQAVKGDVKDVADNFTTNSKDQFSDHGKRAGETGPNAQPKNDQAKEDAKAADDQLKQTSKQFADAWKAKYGHDFNLDRKNEPLVYSGDTFQIMQGDLSTTGQQPRPAGGEVGPSGAGLDANRHSDASHDLSTNASVNGPTGTSAKDTGVSGSARVGDTTVGGTAGTGGVDVNHPSTDTNTAKDDHRSLTDRLTGRDRNAAADMDKRMATVMVKESHGAPALTLTLVNEGTFGNRWHIQPPPGLDYKTLSMNLNHHLQEVLNMKDQWPQDENEAYKSVSHHMLAAIAMPMEKQAGAQPDVNTAQPAGQLQQPSDQSSQQPQQPQQQQNQLSR